MKRESGRQAFVILKMGQRQMGRLLREMGRILAGAIVSIGVSLSKTVGCLLSKRKKSSCR